MMVYPKHLEVSSMRKNNWFGCLSHRIAKTFQGIGLSASGGCWSGKCRISAAPTATAAHKKMAKWLESEEKEPGESESKADGSGNCPR